MNRRSFRFSPLFVSRPLFAKRMRIYGGGEGERMIRWKKRDRSPRPIRGHRLLNHRHVYAIHEDTYGVYCECNFMAGEWCGEGRSRCYVCMRVNGGKSYELVVGNAGMITCTWMDSIELRIKSRDRIGFGVLRLIYWRGMFWVCSNFMFFFFFEL